MHKTWTYVGGVLWESNETSKMDRCLFAVSEFPGLSVEEKRKMLILMESAPELEMMVRRALQNLAFATDAPSESLRADICVLMERFDRPEIDGDKQ